VIEQSLTNRTIALAPADRAEEVRCRVADCAVR
jgi:hypothetical protein